MNTGSKGLQTSPQSFPTQRVHASERLLALCSLASRDPVELGSVVLSGLQGVGSSSLRDSIVNDKSSNFLRFLWIVVSEVASWRSNALFDGCCSFDTWTHRCQLENEKMAGKARPIP